MTKTCSVRPAIDVEKELPRLLKTSDDSAVSPSVWYLTPSSERVAPFIETFSVRVLVFMLRTMTATEPSLRLARTEMEDADQHQRRHDDSPEHRYQRTIGELIERHVQRNCDQIARHEPP